MQLYSLSDQCDVQRNFHRTMGCGSSFCSAHMFHGCRESGKTQGLGRRFCSGSPAAGRCKKISCSRCPKAVDTDSAPQEHSIAPCVWNSVGALQHLTYGLCILCIRKPMSNICHLQGLTVVMNHHRSFIQQDIGPILIDLMKPSQPVSLDTPFSKAAIQQLA